MFLLAFIGCHGNAQDNIDNKNEETKTIEKIDSIQSSEPIKDNKEGSSIYEDMSEDEKESFLTGIWYYYFPMPDRNFGHEFQNDHKYFFFNPIPQNSSDRFIETRGSWKIEQDLILVHLESYIMSDRDAVEMPFGIGYPSDTEYIIVPIDDDNWYEIGTFESIRTGIIKNGKEFPPRITLYPMMIEQVLEEEQYYYRNRP